MISSADHVRSGNRLSFTSGQGDALAFAVELALGVQEFTDDHGELEVGKLDYDKLPPILKYLYDLAMKYGLKPALVFGALAAISNWSQPFLLQWQEHVNNTKELEQAHALRLEEITKENHEKRKTLEHEYHLKRQHELEIKKLSKEEELFLDWLDQVPAIQAPGDNNTYDGAMNILQEMLRRYNSLLISLRKLEEVLESQTTEQQSDRQQETTDDVPPIVVPRKILKSQND